MRYTWDARKNALNIRKHRIAFQDAVRIFERDLLQRPDERHHYGEERWIAIGIAKGAEIFVVYSEEGDDIRRIISARPATRRERALYWRTVG